jgi:hypothetical protein
MLPGHLAGRYTTMESIAPLSDDPIVPPSTNWQLTNHSGEHGDTLYQGSTRPCGEAVQVTGAREERPIEEELNDTIVPALGHE